MLRKCFKGIFSGFTTLFVALSLVVIAHVGHAQQRSIDFSNDGINSESLDQYEQRIQTLKATLVTIANEVGDIKNCHDQRLIYNSGGCVNPVTPESDPTRASQANISTALTTCPVGEAHQWDGSSWSCKEIRNPVNSGVPTDLGTWQLTSGENCGDVFARPCVPSDDTCPTPGNPMGVSCTVGDGSCIYVNNSRNFSLYMCN